MNDGGIIDDAAIQSTFARLIAFGASPRGALSAIGRYGVSSTRLRFRNQVDPDGKRWPPSERVRKHGGQTLRLTGRLRNSLTFNVQTWGVEWGTNVKYAAAHQNGVNRVVQVKPHLRVPVKFSGKGKSKSRELGKPHGVRAHSMKMNIPKRAFLGMNSVDKAAVLRIMADQLAAVQRG